MEEKLFLVVAHTVPNLVAPARLVAADTSKRQLVDALVSEWTGQAESNATTLVGSVVPEAHVLLIADEVGEGCNERVSWSMIGSYDDLPCLLVDHESIKLGALVLHEN